MAKTIVTVKVSCPARIKTAMKLLISANNLLLAIGLTAVIAIIVTFCHQQQRVKLFTPHDKMLSNQT